MNSCETREVFRTRNTDVGEGMVLVLSVSSLRVRGGSMCKWDEHMVGVSGAQQRPRLEREPRSHCHRKSRGPRGCLSSPALLGR